MGVAVAGDGGLPFALHVDRDRQFGDRSALLEGRVKPGVEEHQEDPLRPANVVRVGGRQGAVPVVAEAEHLQLAGEVGDVAFGALPRRRARADRVLLGGQAEGVEPHRVHHGRAPHPFEAGDDVGGRVALRVADVQALTAGVGEHVEHVGLPRPVGLIGAGCGQSWGCEGAPGVPPLLPLRLDPRRLVAGHPARFRGAAGAHGRRPRVRIGERPGVLRTAGLLAVHTGTMRF